MSLSKNYADVILNYARSIVEVGLMNLRNHQGQGTSRRCPLASFSTCSGSHSMAWYWI